MFNVKHPKQASLLALASLFLAGVTAGCSNPKTTTHPENPGAGVSPAPPIIPTTPNPVDPNSFIRRK